MSLRRRHGSGTVGIERRATEPQEQRAQPPQQPERRLPDQSPPGKQQFQEEVVKLMQSMQAQNPNLARNMPIEEKLKTPLPEAPHVPPPIGGKKIEDQLKMAEEYWLRESTIQKNGVYFSFVEWLLPDDAEGERRMGQYIRLPWNRQDNIPGVPRLVYHIQAFKATDFGRSEIFMLFAKMMFLNGDCYNTSMFSSWIVARLVQQELITMLIEIIVQRDQEQNEEEEEEGAEPNEPDQDLRTPAITYSEIVAWMRDNCPMRLRRLVQYQMAEQRRMHKFYRVKPESWPKEKREFLIDDLRETLPKDVRRFREACPFLYKTMTEGTGAVQNLRFYTCEEYREGEAFIDLHQKAYMVYLKEYRENLSQETKERLEAVKSISLCSLTGRKNSYYAAMFHDFLGKPPLETDLIYILDFLARELVREIVIMALRIRRTFVDNTEHEAIEAQLYVEVASAIREENEHARLLCGKAFNMPDEAETEFPTEMTIESTAFEAAMKRGKEYNSLAHMRQILETAVAARKAQKKEQQPPPQEPVPVILSGADVSSMYSAEMLLTAFKAAQPPKSEPGTSSNQKQKKRKRGQGRPI